jgi:hypothetical protein
MHEVIPWDERTASVRILRGGKEIHAQTLGHKAPSVRFRPTTAMKHTAQSIDVEWETPHEASEVSQVLRYSHDGGQTWRALAVNPSDSHHEVDLNFLAGGPHCVFQLLSTAGLRTTVVETEPFALPRKPVRAFILAPETGTSLGQGAPVTLRGGGFSPDFGSSDFEDLIWTSNIDGYLGVGHEVVLHRLALGRHRISLTMADGLGGEANASVFLVVQSDAEVALTAVADKLTRETQGVQPIRAAGIATYAAIESDSHDRADQHPELLGHGTGHR